MRDIFDKIRRALTPEGSIARQSVTSGIWFMMTNILHRGFQIAMVLVLGRLLSPREFGIMGVALLVLASLRRFSRLGLTDALIYNEQEDVDDYLNTIWILNITRGVVIAAILIASAPYAAMAFNEPRVTEILPPLAITPILSGARNPAIIYFKKDLKFHKQFVYDVSSAAALFLVAVGYALVNPTIWALVIGYISTDAMKFVSSYLISKYRPWPEFDLKKAKELVNYGKWITGANVTNFIRTQGDDAVVGVLLSSTTLGFYQMAYRLSNAPATEISNVISGVAFPAYSKVQDDLPALRAGFFRVVNLSISVAAPAGVGIAVVAPTFVETFLGAEWLPMVPAMQILALYAVPRALGSTYGTVWRAIGKPDYVPKIEVASLFFIAIFIYPATTRYGIAGTSFVLFGVLVFIMLPVQTYLTAMSLDITVRAVVHEVAYPLAASAGMGIVVFLVQDRLVLNYAILEFVVLVGTGVVTYCAAVLLIELQFDWGIIQEIRAIRDML